MDDLFDGQDLTKVTHLAARDAFLFAQLSARSCLCRGVFWFGHAGNRRYDQILKNLNRRFDTRCCADDFLLACRKFRVKQFIRMIFDCEVSLFSLAVLDAELAHFDLPLLSQEDALYLSDANCTR